jgi:DNA-directed RNA polymerase subunit K/omega
VVDNEAEDNDKADSSSVDTSNSDIESETDELNENDPDTIGVDIINNTIQPSTFKINKKQKRNTKQPKSNKSPISDSDFQINTDINIEEEDDNDESEDEENYLQKFDDSIRKNIIAQYHPEMIIKNSAEIETLSRVVRDNNGNIIDPFHKTLPFLTKYEKARILGERANQINEGSPIFVKVDSDVIDGYLIALKEFEERKIPFIIQRPIPNGKCEYWKLTDLEII